MRSRPYCAVDVFSDRSLRGNPLAVVLDATGLETARMQAFARWTNLSETAFLLPPQDPRADYCVRIFTPSRELPFAGHPTLGSCHAWLGHGGTPRAAHEIVQQCGVGLVKLRRDGERLAFRAPPMVRAEVGTAQLRAYLAALRLRGDQVQHAQQLDNGPRWIGLLLDSARTVREIEPDHEALARLGLVGVIAPIPTGAAQSDEADCDFLVRAFCAADNIPEDPVTGSLNAALAQWLIADGLAPSQYRVAQGARVHRAGRVHIHALAEDIWVGGACVPCIDGRVVL